MARILVVDDDIDLLETLIYAFEQNGHSVETASDGERALQRARENPPDVALLDVMLPGLNGYEVSRLLKQEMRAGKLRHFPTVMLTARRVHSTERLNFLTSWSGADATVLKPYDLRLLMQGVDELLKHSKNVLKTS